MTDEATPAPAHDGSAPTDDELVEVFKSIYDPDLYIDIWTLGLIRKFDINGSTLDVVITFTSPACPAGPMLMDQIRDKTEALNGIETTNIEVTFNPPWEPSDELKQMMGID